MNGMEERMKSMKKSNIDWAKGFTYPEWKEYYKEDYGTDKSDPLGVQWYYKEECGTDKKSPLNIQCGGGHYKSKAIQPIEYIFANKLGFVEGNIVKYITRWRDKGGVQDLEKIKHYCDLLINEEKELRG